MSGITGTAQGKLGKYDLRGTLGRGAMGTVYDGWDPVIARRVAIKTVRLSDDDDEETEYNGEPSPERHVVLLCLVGIPTPAV